MSSLYIDSNVFFYAKILDRVFGRSCASLIRRMALKEVEASTSVLAVIEVANALRKYGLRSEVSSELRAISSLGIEVYPLEGADAQEAAEIYDEVQISPYDCLHAAVMRKYDLKEIVSADKDFDKIKWLVRLDPRSVSPPSR